ncbi:hypothetical protein ACSBR1_031072 [Camellia fascicularis]
MSFEQYSDNEHMCGVAVHTVKNRRLRSDLVLDIFAQRIRDKPLTRSTDVAFDLKKKYGLEISYRVAWLGVKKARGEFKGNLLAATTKDGNRVAFAIVGAENATNWSWFLQHLRNMLGEDTTLTFISDRHVGLMEAMLIIFPNAHHAFCM